jgi:pimeloyl-ACP methyl ester carboxylesterase
MSYDTARKLEIHDAHQRLIDAFAQSYRCGQPTVVLVPGGMGSQLDRSSHPYHNDGSIPFPAYDPVWIDLEIVFGRDAELIRMEANGHDQGEHIVIPNGPLRFLVKAYDGTEAFFRELGWNYVVFGYDWRRSLAESAAELEEFLSNVRERVKQLRDCDPLPTTTLLAHSQGGLVTKIFLHRVAGEDGATIGRWMERFVSIATPFYGTSKHQDVYYQGKSPLNTFYGTQRIAEIAGSLPGPYVLMFADLPTLVRDGPALGLQRYPLFDAADNGQPVDPYDPANRGRFPGWMTSSYFDQARRIRETITAPLPPAVLNRVFHLRSGLQLETAIELAWQNVNGSTYDPAVDPSPLSAVEGPGDGTVPFWSARLAQTPPNQVYDLRMAVDHGDLAEHDEPLQVVKRLIRTGKLPKPSAIKATKETWGTAKASQARTNALLAGAKSGAITKSDPLANDPEVWRRLMEQVVLC